MILQIVYQYPTHVNLNLTKIRYHTISYDVKSPLNYCDKIVIKIIKMDIINRINRNKCNSISYLLLNIYRKPAKNQGV